ncbi:Hypothetical protein UVM_LOCUS108 [uncultured virus]|nr:Hypothetical protein UVM_LOCUS108 [uncultured virus]
MLSDALTRPGISHRRQLPMYDGNTKRSLADHFPPRVGLLQEEETVPLPPSSR